MGLRDFLLFLLVFGALPLILLRPSFGVMVWVWLGLMNPHRQAWGLAYSFPFSQVVAGATLIGLLFSREPRQFKGGAAAWALLAFSVWTLLTTQFALVPQNAWPMLDRVLKIQLFTFVSLLVLYQRKHVNWLVATIVASIGYYGIKGGAFTLGTGGTYRVWGPAGSFIYDNNALAVAVIMSIPLWGYLLVIASKRWMKLLILGCIFLSAAAALGSHSRGALLAIVAMSAVLWLKSRRKLLLAPLFVFAGLVLPASMTSDWDTRMATISTYEQDGSAQGRLDAWRMLFNLAVDRPIVGGGFEANTAEVYEKYNPIYVKPQAAHSIYFQVLGEHGFVGFGLYLLFWLLTWRMGWQIITRTRDRPDLSWAHWLAKMVQVSLVGYFVGGAFLNLAYWDMPYYLMVLLAVTRHCVRQELASSNTAGDVHQPAAKNEGPRPYRGLLRPGVAP